MHDPASEDYLSLQQHAGDLTREQAELRRLTKDLHAEFAAAMAERDVLLNEWRGALRRHDVAPAEGTLSECQDLARVVRVTDARLIELAAMRRDVRQYRRKLRRDASRASIHVVRARRSLDRVLFDLPPASAPAELIGEAETPSFFHDMREHLTVSVLAAGKLGTFGLTPRAARYHDSLIRGLTGLTEDLDVLDPVQIDARPRPTLTLLPPPTPPTESAPIPGT